MCLAIPGQIVECDDGQAVVDFQGNRAEICTVLTPDAQANDWVLVHAGFAITRIDEQSARETWSYLNGLNPDEVMDEIAIGERQHEQSYR